MMQPMAKNLLVTLPGDRAKSYTDHCRSSSSDPSALYLWGIDMAAALHEVLGMTEIAIRGAIDSSLQNFARTHGVASGEWIKEIKELPHLPEITFMRGEILFPYNNLRNQVRKQERGRAADHPRPAGGHSHGDLVSQVMFGTWGAMLPDRSDGRSELVKEAINGLWADSVNLAFPNQIRSIRRFSAPQTIGDHVRLCVTLRNRINHVDSLLNVDIPFYLDGVILPLLKAIDHDVYLAVYLQSRIEAVWHRRPIKFSGRGLDLRKISRRH